MTATAVQTGKGLPENNIVRFLFRVENILCITALVFLVLYPASEAVARLVFKTGVPASATMTRHLLLVAGMIAGMITTRDGDHLAIGLVQHFSNETVKTWLKSLAAVLSVFVVTVIAWSSFSFIKIGLEGHPVGFLSDRIFASVIPLGYGVIALRFFLLSGFKGWKKVIPVLAVVGGTLASFPVIAKFIWGFDMPDSVFEICERFYTFSYYSKTPLVIFLIAAALAGTPLFVILGGLALLLIHAGGGELDSVTADIYSGLTNSSIIAIPLFTLAGFFLSESKAGERLVHTFRSLFSWIPGGIIIASVAICVFFTSFTGASGVTILALGGILYSILSEHMKYPPRFSIGLLTSVGGIGILFPPSLPIILVGATTQTNIKHMFVGGIFPGLLLMVVVIIFGIIVSVKIKVPVEKFELRKAAAGLKKSWLEILLPVFLIAGYFTGIISLVEIGAAAVLYIFVAEVLVHKDIKFADVPKVFIKAIPIIGGVLSILALSKAFSYYIVDTQAPMNLARWLQDAVSSKIVFLLLLNVVLLIIGCVMDIFSAILIVLPLISPMGEVYGIDPVHLGIIFLINMEVGFLTPPVGLNLFFATYRFNRSFVDVCRYVFPFMLVQFVVVLLVTYLPWLSTYLTRFF